MSIKLRKGKRVGIEGFDPSVSGCEVGLFFPISSDHEQRCAHGSYKTSALTRLCYIPLVGLVGF